MHVLWIAVVIIVIDQVTKLAVLQNMYVGQSIPLIGDWLKFTFTENPGMAFGITVGPDGFVSVLSITATTLISYYLYRVRHSYSWYRMSIGCILGGALGNIIDRVFYGAIFYDSRLFTGHVVDFIHVNLWRGYVPESWPVIGGKYAALFPIWNVADMAIVLGVIGILVFQNKFQESLLEAAGGHSAFPGLTEPDSTTSSGEREPGGSDAPGVEGQNETTEPAPAGNSADKREAGDKLPPSSLNREPTVGE